MKPGFGGAFVVGLAVALFGCGETEPSSPALLGITVTAIDAETRMVHGVIRNVSDADLYHSHCVAQLQYREGGDWELGQPDHMCPLPLITLRPGHEVEFQAGPATGATDCGYRVVAAMHASMASEGAGERVEATTEPFCLD